MRSSQKYFLDETERKLCVCVWRRRSGEDSWGRVLRNHQRVEIAPFFKDFQGWFQAEFLLLFCSDVVRVPWTVRRLKASEEAPEQGLQSTHRTCDRFHDNGWYWKVQLPFSKAMQLSGGFSHPEMSSGTQPSVDECKFRDKCGTGSSLLTWRVIRGSLQFDCSCIVADWKTQRPNKMLSMAEALNNCLLGCRRRRCRSRSCSYFLQS